MQNTGLQGRQGRGKVMVQHTVQVRQIGRQTVCVKHQADWTGNQARKEESRRAELAGKSRKTQNTAGQ